MSLEKELGLRKGFANLWHETILNVYYSGMCVKKTADNFFRQFGLTDVQFSVLMTLTHQSTVEPITQADLSRMMMVNPANVTGLIDRMEKSGLVKRVASDDDRRTNFIKLTAKGRKLFEKVEPLYAETVKNTVSSLSKSEQTKLIEMLEKLRSKIADTK